MIDMTKRWTTGATRGLVLAAAVAALGCSAEPEQTLENEPEPLGEQAQELSASEHCDTVAANLVWNGGGKVRTSASYATTGCGGAYLIDLNNYDKENTKGTRVTFGRVIPTTQAECTRTQVRAYVWKKNGSAAATFLGSDSVHGSWVTDPLAGSRCVVPNLVLERSIPGYVTGGSYRLALSARLDDTSGGFALREIYVATEQPTFERSVFRQEQDMQILVEDIQGAGPRIVPNIQAYFGKRGSTAAAMECRVMEIELSAMKVSALSLQQAGAASATTTQRINAFDSLYRGYCTGTAPTMSDMQQRVLTYFTAVLDIEGEISVGLGLNGGAAEVMASINRFDMSRIMAGCGTEPREFERYVRTGATPSGMTGPNVLLRNCTSDVAATQSKLGMTGSSSDIRKAMKRCVVEAFDKPPLEEQPAACGDPRASGGSECVGDCHAPNTTGPCALNPASQACFDQVRKDTGFTDLGDPQVQADKVEEWLTTGAYYQALNQVSMTNDQIKELTMQAARNGLLKAQEELRAFDTSMSDNVTKDPSTGQYTYKSGAAREIERGVKLLAVKMAQDNLTKVTLEQQGLPAAEQKVKDEREKLCKAKPNHPECQPPNTADPTKQCPQTDLDGGPVWFNHMDGSRMSISDRIATCTCETMRRTSFGTAVGLPQEWICQTAEEKKRFDCQTNPWGPDDGQPNPILRPECKNAFQPSSVERDVLLAGLCDKVQCAEDQVGLVVNGRCTCLTNPTPATIGTKCNFNGPAGALDCGDGNLVCDAEGPRCQNPRSGRTPFGSNPLCLVPGKVTQLGGAPVWGHQNANDYFSSLVTVSAKRRDAFMMKQGFRMIAGPENFKVSYDEVGTTLVAEVLQPATLPADRGDIEAFCSNPETGANNIFLGIQPFVAGLNTVSFPLDPRCWGTGTTATRFGFGVRTASDQAARAAFLGYRLGGDFTRTLTPVEACGPDDPDPRPDFVDPGLLNALRLGTIVRGTIDSTWFGNTTLGGSALQAPTVPVVRLFQ